MTAIPPAPRTNTMTNVHATHTIKSIFNFRNAKTFAFLIMLCFSIYHGVLMLIKPGGNLCKSLLSDGSAGPAGEWRPFGCMTHIYNTKDSKVCIKELASRGNWARLYFIGDSRLFTLFDAFTKHLNGSWTSGLRSQSNFTDVSLILKNEQSIVCFLRHDEITSETINLIAAWQSTPGAGVFSEQNPNVNASLLSASASKLDDECLKQPPTHLVLSLGTATISRFNQSDIGLLDYQRSLEALARALSSMSLLRTVWMLQDPVAEGLLTPQHKSITNKAIDDYNNVAQKFLLGVPGMEVWRSNRLIAQRMGFPAVEWHCPEPSPVEVSDTSNIKEAVIVVDSVNKVPPCTQPPPLSDGFHVSPEAMYQNVQVLLNLYCNNQMKFEDGTCCRSAEPITPVQKRCFIFITLCLVLTALCFVYDNLLRSRLNFCFGFLTKLKGPRCFLASDGKPLLNHTGEQCAQSTGTTSSKTTLFQDFYELTVALSKFGLILIYFFVCDRTILFMKTNKGFTFMSFILPLTYIFVLGLFFSGPTKETRLNHFDITREWKGWMQVYFLIYHFTGSYRVVPLYLFTRYFVSAYLFLSGFGHFHYLWHQPMPNSVLRLLIPCRFSIRELYATTQAWWIVIHRYLDVMYRMNFFVLGLCLVMNRDYLFYYFMPLVSFWFTVTMVLMLIFPRVSAYGVATTSDPVSTGGKSHSPAETLFLASSCLPASDAPLFDQVVVSRSSDDYNPKSSPTSPQQTDRRPLIMPALAPTLRPSQSQSSIDWRGHQKALSLGTGFDVRQWSELSAHSPIPPPLRRCPRKCKVTKSGPPWTEDLIRKAWSVIPTSSGPDYSNVRLSNTYCRSKFLSRCWCCCRLRLADMIILIKFALLITAIELLHLSPSLFHAVFFSGPQKRLFQLNTTAPNPMEPYGDEAFRVDEFWFYRWSLDRYSLVYGMIFALLCEWARRVGYLNDSKSGDLGLPASTAEYMKRTSVTMPLTSSSSSDLLRTPEAQKFTFMDEPHQPAFSLDTLHNPPQDQAGTSASHTFLYASDRTNQIGRSSINLDYTSRSSYQPRFSNIPFRTVDGGYGLLSKITCRRFTAIVLTICGFIGIGLSVLFVFKCDNRQLCAEVHAFLCLLPILSYILIRNCLGTLRRNHSVMFAWLGDISLELFIAQHHIWLSADGNGILVLLPGYPLLNLALTTFVFICVSCELHNLTQRLRRFLLPSKAFPCLRNLVLFGIIVHLITSSHEF
ncbi:hypothetical protein EG68_03536 [Paragonimus skrjabini miyazakii]|uniref:Cas1p 10 TM acyl transferase domain-containing protein n=1 Tax=Paragonimus skrjabini miyazakii TaxID=59628 RepID=A0A8S9YWV8_9TREM|nr:hypothetical protein EG68_03536 [Paragonimus skrjabini miyazakii]